MFVGAGLTAQVAQVTQVAPDWRVQRGQAPAYETDSKKRRAQRLPDP